MGIMGYKQCIFAGGSSLFGSIGSRRMAIRTRALSGGKDGIIWMHAHEKGHITSMLESGLGNTCSLVVDGADIDNGRLQDWQRLGTLGDIVVISEDGTLQEWSTGKIIGEYWEVCGPEDMKRVEDLALGEAFEHDHHVVMDAKDWKVIPVENVIAAFQKRDDMKLLIAVRDVEEADLMLSIMEHGSDGVVFSPPPGEGNGGSMVRNFSAFVEKRLNSTGKRKYTIGRVTKVQQVGLGDRACLDLAENLSPGSGIFLGSFARGFFLVHSECEETSYINSRPFRVNAGPVHSYIDLGDTTGYVAEIKSGDEVTVFDADGNSKRSIVGRVKLEKRPLVMIEAEGIESGIPYSIMLQNAETVKLVGPDDASSTSSGWKTLSVSEITEGDHVYLFEYIDSGARHTGILINETIHEY